MGAYVVRRIFVGAIILLLVTILVFLLVRLLPGDPLMVYVGQFNTGGSANLGPEELANLRHLYGLDRPMVVQYWDWITDILRGDFGKSITIGASIGELIRQRMPITAYIGVITFVIGTSLGLIMGLICALRRGSWLDNTLTTLANIGMTVPTFWLGILLIYLFATTLGWLPSFGWVSPFDNFWESTQRLIMPVAAVTLGGVAGMARFMRSCMLEVMRTDYVRTAWAKGLREKTVVVRHQIKNAIIPVVTAMGGSLAVILGGSVFIETVFGIPGMGRLMTTAIFDHDYQVIQATTLIFGFIIIFSNLVVDILWGWLDPRIRLA